MEKGLPIRHSATRGEGIVQVFEKRVFKALFDIIHVRRVSGASKDNWQVFVVASIVIIVYVVVVKSKKEEAADTNNVYASLKKFEERDRDYIPSSIPGAIFRVELDNTNPLAFGYPDHYYTLKLDDNVYEFIKEGGWNVGVLKKDKAVAGFVGSKLKHKFQDGLLFGVQEIGDGTITYLADDVLFRSFWENGKLMFANAVFLVGQ